MASLTADQRALIASTRSLLLAGTSSIGALQNASLASAETDLPWTIKTTFPAPKDEDGGIRDVVDRAIKRYGRGAETYTQPTIEKVNAWWTTYDDGKPYSTSATGHTKYEEVVRSVDKDVTILYFHGGGFYLSSPMTYLPALQQISNATGFRTFTPQYRLSPESAFPAAIYDATLAYLALLYPPPGSLHAPADPAKVVFAGDSAGANLALSVLQVIHSADSQEVSFHGTPRKLPLPAGVTILSGGLEQTWALPSVLKYVDFDIFGVTPSWLNSSYPHDAIWPATPARANVYCDQSILDHPLAAPCTQADWSWAPPMWFLGGQEIFRDSSAGVVETAVQQGVTVEYEEFQEMPHDFLLWSVIAPWAPTDDWPQTIKAKARWAQAVKTLAEGKCLQSSAKIVNTNGTETVLDGKNLLGISFEERVAIIRRKAATMKPFT